MEKVLLLIKETILNILEEKKVDFEKRHLKILSMKLLWIATSTSRL
jgi:hypothetical protein